MPQHSPEYPMLRNYLELVSELPWNESAVEVIDIQKAQEAWRNKFVPIFKYHVHHYLSAHKNKYRNLQLCYKNGITPSLYNFDL